MESTVVLPNPWRRAEGSRTMAVEFPGPQPSRWASGRSAVFDPADNAPDAGLDPVSE